MRTWRLAVLCLCTLAPATLGAHQDQPSAPGQAQRDFEALLARAKQSDLSVDFARLRRLSSESDSYAGFRDDAEPALREALVGKAFGEALKIAREIQARNYLNFDAHFVAMRSCTELKDEPCAAHHRYMVEGILESIATSGDGTSPATAWVVVSVPEEYVVMAAQGLVVTGQALMEDTGHNYDVLTVRDPKTGEESRVYFNVDLPLAATRRLLVGPAR